MNNKKQRGESKDLSRFSQSMQATLISKIIKGSK